MIEQKNERKRTTHRKVEIESNVVFFKNIQIITWKMMMNVCRFLLSKTKQIIHICTIIDNIFTEIMVDKSKY